jgi:hypothetical protein
MVVVVLYQLQEHVPSVPILVLPMNLVPRTSVDVLVVSVNHALKNAPRNGICIQRKHHYSAIQSHKSVLHLNVQMAIKMDLKRIAIVVVRIVPNVWMVMDVMLVMIAGMICSTSHYIHIFNLSIPSHNILYCNITILTHRVCLYSSGGCLFGSCYDCTNASPNAIGMPNGGNCECVAGYYTIGDLYYGFACDICPIGYACPFNGILDDDLYQYQCPSNEYNDIPGSLACQTCESYRNGSITSVSTSPPYTSNDTCVCAMGWEPFGHMSVGSGDNERRCEECGVDMYKSTESLDACQPCPVMRNRLSTYDQIISSHIIPPWKWLISNSVLIS